MSKALELIKCRLLEVREDGFSIPFVMPYEELEKHVKAGSYHECLLDAIKEYLTPYTGYPRWSYFRDEFAGIAKRTEI